MCNIFIARSLTHRNRVNESSIRKRLIVAVCFHCSDNEFDRHAVFCSKQNINMSDKIKQVGWNLDTFNIILF